MCDRQETSWEGIRVCVWGGEAAGKTGQAEKDLFLKLSSLFLRARIRQKAFYGSNGLVFSLERSAWQNVEESLNGGQSKG